MLLREAFGVTLRKERELQKRTLRDVAAQSYMSLGYLSEIERAKKEISSEVLENLCTALCMSTKDFLVEVIMTMNNEPSYLEKEIGLSTENLALSPL